METNVTIDSIIVVRPSMRNSMGTSKLADRQPRVTTDRIVRGRREEQPERNQERQGDARDDRQVRVASAAAWAPAAAIAAPSSGKNGTNQAILHKKCQTPRFSRGLRARPHSQGDQQ